MGRLSEWLNPILVKEARQALRSRQFTTHVLSDALGRLGCGRSSGSGLDGARAIYYAAVGPSMFYGYHLILAFPLLIVAPYSAFHSLSAERQDRTFELVSITALDARQILSGKLSSIVLQMLVYLSAHFSLPGVHLPAARTRHFHHPAGGVLYLGHVAGAVGLRACCLPRSDAPRQRQIANAVLFAHAGVRCVRRQQQLERNLRL